MFIFKFIYKFFARIIGFIVILALLVIGWPMGLIWHAAHNPTIRSADVIVVLGAAQLDGRPGEVLTARLTETKRIFLLGFAKKIITVGAGAAGDRTTEAATSKRWLVANGLPASAITAIPVGRDTYASTVAYVEELKNRNRKNVIIVTDPYHCKRAMVMANDKGVISTCSPSKTGPSTIDQVGIRYIIRETEAYLAYITLGRRGIHISDRN